MNTNTWTIAWRSLARNKVFSTIGIAGLGLGMTCSLLILLWVKDELRYDHRQPANLARVMTHSLDKNGSIGASGSYTQGLLADALRQQIPEIADAATVLWEDRMIFSVGKEANRESGRYVGNDFFRMFNFPLIKGRFGATPDDIVLTEKLARKYFHGQDPIGQTVRIDNKRDYIVSGIAADVPEQSSITFDYVLPVQHCFQDNPWMVGGWDHMGPDTYVLLRPGADMQKVSAKIRNFICAQDPLVRDKILSLQPYRDIYLHSTFVRGLPDGGRIDYVRLFSLVALFILLIACINFVNLATARAAKRAQEVGVRKSVGARRSSLVQQFLVEAMAFAVCAMLLSAGLVAILLPWFNQLTGKHIVLSADLFYALPVVALATGLLAGVYPALFLSSLKPVSVLKGQLRFGPRSAYLRKGLVWLQFALSILLIVCTIVVSKQLRYVESKNIGLDRSNLVYIPVDDQLGAHLGAFRHDLEESGDIEGMTLVSSMPTHISWYSDNITWQGKTAGDKTALAEMDVTYGFLGTLRMSMAAGRVFSPELPTDSNNFILNETAVRVLGLKEPVGKSFSHQQTKGRIIGVVRDFHMASLHDAIAPLFIQLQPSMRTGVGVIRIRTSSAMEVLANAWATYDPGAPLDYMFADEEFRSHYLSEVTVEQLSRVFSLVAILISCLGLFGLAIFTAEQRMREIGIRKVLGAKTADLFALLSKDFLQPVGLAALCAFPVGGWLMHRWLQGYAYRTTLSWWVFGLSGGLALGIALLTVSYQSLRAARAKPNLRED
ncbi:MAG TPA: ABC transporter permease [Dinghuibacter sp.]|uniref:ABC transporter permease n=1 Tax=Dinghuibacter sp. TaxID=2024697 RepID=UPI002C8D9593|nr:ABC transporter permease [Dinghuibacter sp.]HTJ12062.1 ABC transporter permease [Dinghuibacter sp.]